MSKPNMNKEREVYLAAAAKMYDELRQWREQHPESSIDGSANILTGKAKKLRYAFKTEGGVEDDHRSQNQILSQL